MMSEISTGQRLSSATVNRIIFIFIISCIKTISKQIFTRNKYIIPFCLLIIVNYVTMETYHDSESRIVTTETTEYEDVNML